MTVSKELKRLIKQYTKRYGYVIGRQRAEKEYKQRKKYRRDRRLGIWLNWKR